MPDAQRPRVYYARGPRGLETGLGGSINVETIEFLGARNVAGERQGGLATVSVEQVLAWNPDIIITIDPAFAASVRTDRVWMPIKAVQAGQVHLSPNLPFGWVAVRIIYDGWERRVCRPATWPYAGSAMCWQGFYVAEPVQNGPSADVTGKSRNSKTVTLSRASFGAGLPRRKIIRCRSRTCSPDA